MLRASTGSGGDTERRCRAQHGGSRPHEALDPHPPAIFSRSPDLRWGASEIGRGEGGLRRLTGRNELLASNSVMPVRGAPDWQKRVAGPPRGWQK